MPILEAMAAGIPIVTSNRSALPEVAGNAALLVDPEDATGLSQALRDMTRDRDLREDLARRGAARSGLFTWEQAVQKTWDVYRKILG
jgi:glycosyltransferase involved in cell wall biosynthesis